MSFLRKPSKGGQAGIQSFYLVYKGLFYNDIWIPVFHGNDFTILYHYYTINADSTPACATINIIHTYSTKHIAFVATKIDYGWGFC